MNGWIRSPYVVAGIGIVVAALVFAIVMAVLPNADQAAVLVQLASTAIGLIPVAFLGVIVAELIRRRDADKAQHDERVELRRGFRARTIAAYHESKAIRSVLRGRGLRPDSGIDLSDGLLTALDDQVRELIDVQLAMEQLKREVAAPGAPFDDPEALRKPLEDIEKYLKRVVRDWELGRPALRAGSPATVFDGWRHFQDFVAAKDAPRLPDNPTAAFVDLERAVTRQLGSTPAE